MSAALSLNDSAAQPKSGRRIARSQIALLPFAVRTDAQYRRAIGLLNGTVALDRPSKAHIKILAERFKLGPGVFI